MSLIPQENLNKKIEELSDELHKKEFAIAGSGKGFNDILNLQNHAISEMLHDLITWYNEQIIEEIRKIENKYYSMVQQTIGGERFIVSESGEKLEYGYPFPENKQTYILREIISKLQNTLPDNNN